MIQAMERENEIKNVRLEWAMGSMILGVMNWNGIMCECMLYYKILFRDKMCQMGNVHCLRLMGHVMESL